MRRHIKKLRRTLLFLAGTLLVLAAIRYIHRAPFEGDKIKESLPGHKAETVKFFPFSAGDALKEWEEKVFKGKVVYSIEKSEDMSYVKAASDGAASALYYRIKVDAKNRRPAISWKWKVEKFPTKKECESLDKENEDDFAARVFVIFPAMFLTNSKVLEYVWAENLGVDTVGTSPYSKNIKLIVLRSGLDKDKRWFSEDRDIISDYIKMFGRMPEYNIGAVAFMTNTEHTGSGAEAMYDEIEIGYKNDSVKEGGLADESKILKNKISDR